MPKVRYGLGFPDRASDVDIELFCYRRAARVRELGGEPLSQAEHMMRAARIIWPPEDGVLVWHKWLEEHIHIWCDTYGENRGFATVWGSAAVGKSNDFGLCALLDWWSAPTETVTIVASTSLAELEIRIWEAIIRYYNAARRKGVPGVISRQRRAIINKDDDGKTDDEVKAAIRGVATRTGSGKEGEGRLIGAHLPYVRLIIDEMQGVEEWVPESRFNLSMGCDEFKLIGLGNPDGFGNTLGRYSKPVNGWGTVSVASKRWKTQYGMTYHYDGRDSPAITEPDGAKRFKFLINQAQIDRMIEQEKSADAPKIWTMCYGWPPPEGLAQTVLTEAMISRFGADVPATWGDLRYCTVSGLDPAFSSGGDKCILSIAKVGMNQLGMRQLEFMEPYRVAIEASSGAIVTEQITNQVIDQITLREIEAICIDDSGTQGIADALEIAIRNQIEELVKRPNRSTFELAKLRALKALSVYRVSFGRRASELPIDETGEKASKLCFNKVAEMWIRVRNLVYSSQISNMNQQSIDEFCDRRIQHGRVWKLESKDDVKARRNESPDSADADSLAVDAAAQHCGLWPGVKGLPAQAKIRNRFSLDFIEDRKLLYEKASMSDYTTEYIHTELV